MEVLVLRSHCTRQNLETMNAQGEDLPTSFEHGWDGGNVKVGRETNLGLNQG